MDNSQPKNETTQKTTEQTINENKDCKCYRQADVLDQTRLRAPSLSFTQQLFKRFGLPNPVCRQHDSHAEERIKSLKSGFS